MKTQTKCTLSLCGMLIIEILPIPLTSLISMYVVRKRPAWLPGVVERLYTGKETKSNISQLLLMGHDSAVTRRRCTITLCFMILLDFLLPFTIFMGLYVTRRRPKWFKSVVGRLYADQLSIKKGIVGEAVNSYSVDIDVIENKHLALHKSNIEYALAVANKTK